MQSITELIHLAKATDKVASSKKRKRGRERGKADLAVSESADSTEAAEETKRKKKKKKRRTKEHRASKDGATDTTGSGPCISHPPSSVVAYPYDVDDDDHCESPVEAYADLAPLLTKVALEMGKTPATLRIYDPFFCEGAVVSRLASLGFSTVYNKPEDFYAKVDSNTIPEYDCLVTNPPYSADHIERLLRFCASTVKPFFLLLPNFVYMKPYCIELFRGPSAPKATAGKMFFVSPMTRYLYTTPKGRRQKKSGKYTAPFPTFWYCRLCTTSSRALEHALRDQVATTSASPKVCRDAQQLPIEVICDEDPRKKKAKNAAKRKKHKLRKTKADKGGT